METVTSEDGTTIAFDRLGNGPPLILVCGGSVDRRSNAELARFLADDLTVLNFDRRGRGGPLGSSSGAALALMTAASGLPVTRLALWEPPYVPEGLPPPPEDQVERQGHAVDPAALAPVLVEFFG